MSAYGEKGEYWETSDSLIMSTKGPIVLLNTNSTIFEHYSNPITVNLLTPTLKKERWFEKKEIYN